MANINLQSRIDSAGNPLDYLRSSKVHRRGNRDWDPKLIMPQVPYEFTDWEEEQIAWRDAVALFDQSHHMQAVMISGPDAKAFLSHMACNNLAKAHPGRAFQILCASPDGHMVGDGILLQQDENSFAAVSPYLLNWLAYHAETLDFDVTATIDPRSPVYANGHGNVRPECRYQIQGPHAWALIEKLNGGPVADVPFFHTTEMTIAGLRVKGLRHGMAGAPGLEVWGPWEERDRIRDTILKDGEAFGIREVGAAAYLTSAVESGWLHTILPAIYSAEGLKGYREWMSGDDLEGLIRLTGTQQGGGIEDFYRTPFDLGYGRLIHFEHEFVGRDALLGLREAPKLQKLTLAWDPEDTAHLFKETLLPNGRNVKVLHLPTASDKLDMQYFRVTARGRDVGTAHSVGYLAGERAMLSLALLDPSIQVGDEVELHWGESGGGFGSYVTPATDVVPVRAIVSPAPYSRVAREEYRKN